MSPEERKMFPILIGVEGRDDFFLKYATGEIVPWPTEEERQEWVRMADACNNPTGRPLTEDE